MRMTLQRKGQIKSFEAVLKIEKMTPERKDLVEILQFIHENGGVATEDLLEHKIGAEVPTVVIKGIISHLKSIGLLTLNGVISLKGKKVVESGVVPVAERGQFQVYYLQDEFLKHSLLHYERTAKGKRSDVASPLKGDLFTGMSCKSVNTGHEFKIKEFDGRNPSGFLAEDSGTYEIIWSIDINRENSSIFYVSGELKVSASSLINFRQHEVEGVRDINVKELLYMIIDKCKPSNMHWNVDTECLEVPFNEINEIQCQKLEMSLKIPPFKKEGMGAFEATEIHNISIGPQNAEDAKKWIRVLIKKFTETGYKNHQELMNYLAELKEHKAFLHYKYIIDTITMEELARELHANSDFESYWNLQAPKDLFLDVEDRFVVHNRRINIAPGKRLSMMEIVQEVVGNDRPEILVFSSKYVINPAQIKKFHVFVDCFRDKGVQQILLVSKIPVEMAAKDVSIELYEDVYPGIQPHDRYFAYKSNGVWHRFKMTAELDQCRYENWRNAREHTIGTWQDISFIEIMPEVFPQGLNEKLNSLEEVLYL
ncbi:hypothetical protein [Halobacillus halophilus]|uniref:hypothetical protein n=1 Tax=Halobacillus halophilus TaxID=1570 RepID=UPI001CD2C143|nr:hypothetical protein [Halobacillus halophilus]MCA1011747.1 hypothetical protein [Halobacillus halophilus]